MENPPSERARNPWGIFKLNGLCTDFDDSKAEGPEEYVTFSTARWKTSTRRIHRCAYVSPPRRTSSIRRYTGKEKYEFANWAIFGGKTTSQSLGRILSIFAIYSPELWDNLSCGRPAVSYSSRRRPRNRRH